MLCPQMKTINAMYVRGLLGCWRESRENELKFYITWPYSSLKYNINEGCLCISDFGSFFIKASV